MLILEEAEIRRLVNDAEIVDRMREALIAQSRGECDTPMPMHLDIAPAGGEVHIKSSYRRGGRYYALKMATSFPRNVERGLSSGNGMMLLASAETGEPLALLADAGHLTDVRTAAATAMTARELGREDTSIGILGSGIQARLSARLHASVLPLKEILLWGRTPERVAACRDEIAALVPGVEVIVVSSPAEAGAGTRLIVTATASREPLLHYHDLLPGTHVSAVGADSPGKRELDAGILRHAAIVLADSRAQCERLGELQHAPSEWARAIEIGAWCAAPVAFPPDAVTVADFTGLGVEDLYIAESVYEKHQRSVQ